MPLSVVLNNRKKFPLFYSAKNFQTGLTVTGYFIYPDLQKSSPFTFSELGDGIYGIEIINNRNNEANTEKYGVVIKENGEIRKFEIIYITY